MWWQQTDSKQHTEYETQKKSQFCSRPAHSGKALCLIAFIKKYPDENRN